MLGGTRGERNRREGGRIGLGRVRWRVRWGESEIASSFGCLSPNIRSVSECLPLPPSPLYPQYVPCRSTDMTRVEQCVFLNFIPPSILPSSVIVPLHNQLVGSESLVFTPQVFPVQSWSFHQYPQAPQLLVLSDECAWQLLDHFQGILTQSL